MGKTKHSRPSGQKAVWESEDELALFALLDFSIKYPDTLPFNEEKVVPLFRTAGSLHEGYTKAQIDRKLHTLWYSHGSDDSPDKADIYLKGSACLGLTEEEQIAVKSIVERLEKSLRPKSFREKSLNLPASRKASASPLTHKRTQSHIPEPNISDRGRPTPKTPRQQSCEPSKWGWDPPEDSSIEDEPPRKRIQKLKERASSDKKNKQSKQDPEERHESLLEEQQQVIADNEFRLSINENRDGLPIAFGSRRKSHRKVTPLRLGSEVRRLQGDPLPSPTTLERIHRAMIQKKDEQIMKLRETISSQDMRLDEFQTQQDSLKSVQERQQEGEDSLEIYASNLSQEIQHLKKAKDDCRKIGSFTKLAGRYDGARDSMKMETQVPIIRRLMKNILGACDDDTTLKVPIPTISVGLRKLIFFVMGLEFDEKRPLGEEQFKSLLSSRPPYSVIESLIEAAVCTWVFESDFPNFEQETGPLDLFTKYRELIATQDGAVALRNLELASHHALINSPKFSHLINQEASDLAILLSKTLSPFFPRNAAESEKHAFETWGEEESVWNTRQRRLITIFKDSLKIKAESLLTPESYELIQYAPGTIFDASTMDVETVDGSPIDAPAVEEDHTVEHCLHAAIRAFTREHIKFSDSVEKATIQYKNFTRRDSAGAETETELTSTVLVKAIVVLGKRNTKGKRSSRGGVAKKITGAV